MNLERIFRARARARPRARQGNVGWSDKEVTPMEILSSFAPGSAPYKTIEREDEPEHEHDLVAAMPRCDLCASVVNSADEGARPYRARYATN